MVVVVSRCDGRSQIVGPGFLGSLLDGLGTVENMKLVGLFNLFYSFEIVSVGLVWSERELLRAELDTSVSPRTSQAKRVIVNRDFVI